MCTTGTWIILTVAVVIAKSSAQSLPCVSNGQPCSNQLCPGTAVQLACKVPDNKILSITQWTISPNCTLNLNQRDNVGCSNQSKSCFPFTALNSAVDPTTDICNTSTLSFVVSPNLNGTSITCATATVAGIIGSITLISVAPPAQPSVSVTPGLYDLLVMWTPNGGSPTNYTITLMNARSVVSSSTNLTSTRFTGLLSDTAFSIAVVAINCAGNATKYVTTGTLSPPPTKIQVGQAPQGTTTQLTITWTHVGGTVTQYNIMSSSQGYNVTSSPLVKDICFGTQCSFIQNVKTTGVLYNVTIASINEAGVGPWSGPKQGVIIQQTSADAVGIGVGVSLGVFIIGIFAIIAVLAFLVYTHSRRSITIPGPPVEEHQIANLELILYAVEWQDRPAEYELCSPIYITCQLNSCVLELKDGHQVVMSRRRLPPHDCQLWYLIDQSDRDTFLIASKLNGKVLSSVNDQQSSKESLLWRKDGNHIMSVSRKTYAIGISGGHREPGYPVVLCEMKDNDMSQDFDERPAIVPSYYIECQETCGKLFNHSKDCAECYRCVEIDSEKPPIYAGFRYTPQSTDAQRWYIEYLHGQSDRSFLIISKLNGKALYCEGGAGGRHVAATECNENDDRQHWTRKKEDLCIFSKKINWVFLHQPGDVFNRLGDNHWITLVPSINQHTKFAIKNCSGFCHIQDFKSDLVLDLEHEPNGSVCKSNGAGVVSNPKADPPTDNQQWYLHPLPKGHYLVVSKLHGKVLTYERDEEGRPKCSVTNSNGGQYQMWKKEVDSVVSVKYDYPIGKCVDIIDEL